MKLSVMLFPFQNGKNDMKQLVHDLAIAGATALEPMESRNVTFPKEWEVWRARNAHLRRTTGEKE